MKFKWKGLDRVVVVSPYGAVERWNKERLKFKVNGKRVKHYLCENKDLKLIGDIDLKESKGIKPTCVGSKR